MLTVQNESIKGLGCNFLDYSINSSSNIFLHIFNESFVLTVQNESIKGLGCNFLDYSINSSSNIFLHIFNESLVLTVQNVYRDTTITHLQIIITPGRRQSKMLILSTKVDKKSSETEFLIAICLPTGDKLQLKARFLSILIQVHRL